LLSQAHGSLRWEKAESHHVGSGNITHEQLVSFCDRARRSFYLAPSYLAYKLKQSLLDRRELQRNVKGFVTLSKYLLRGSEHDKNATSAKPSTPAKPHGATV